MVRCPACGEGGDVVVMGIAEVEVEIVADSEGDIRLHTVGHVAGLRILRARCLGCGDDFPGVGGAACRGRGPPADLALIRTASEAQHRARHPQGTAPVSTSMGVY